MTTTEAETNKESAFIENVNGYKLFCRYWNANQTEAKSNFRALVFICHGYAEHSGNYHTVAKQLVAQEFFVFSHDHVGHGQSEGTRVDITNFEDYITDVISHINSVKKSHPDCPVFIVGHSLGGLITAKAALKEPELIQGIVLISPSIYLDPNMFTPWKVCGVTAISKIFPQFPVVAPLDSNLLCRDPKVVENFVNDPLNYHCGIKARWITCYYKSLSAFNDQMPQFKCPILLLHGDKDGICKMAGSQQLHEQAASTDKTLKIFPGAYHQLHNEPDGMAEEVMQDIINWINARI